METAKVEIRKLQLLNDRINQCLDALNQVRLSVHGLSHSAGGMSEAQAPGYGPQQDPRLGAAFGQTGFAPQAWAPGISHSAAGYGSMAGGLGPSIPSPFGSQIPGLAGPFAGAQTPYGLPFAGAQIPYGLPFAGLSHSSPELEAYNRPTWADPVLASRVAQTFPYARFVIPPIVSLY